MRRAARVLAIVLLAAAAIAGPAIAALRSQEPFAALPRAKRPATLIEERREPFGDRTLLHVALDGGAIGPIRFVVSLPAALPPGEKLPIAVVLGSLRGGSRAIREISEVVGDPGRNAFVGYDWPLPKRDPEVVDIVLHPRAWRRSILVVPAQVDAVLAWAERQAWGDPERTSLLGFSLGAFVTPAAQRLAQERGARVGWTILAYAGAPIGDVIAGHPKAGPAWLRRALGPAADLLLRPVEPSFHLPHLQGRFLVMGAATDRLIDPVAAERLRDLTPAPRTDVRIGGDHMGVGAGKAEVLRRVVEASRSWLVAEGAIEPPGAS